MGFVRLSGDAIWASGIEGDVALRQAILSLPAGQTIELEIEGTVGTWEKMKDGCDGRPTNGVRPIGPMRDLWKLWQEQRGRSLRVRRATTACPELMALRPLLEEWDTPEDDEAYRDLPLQ